MPASPSGRRRTHPSRRPGRRSGVAEALHQLCPGSAHPLGAPTGARRLPREPVARHRRNHEMECVRGARAVRRGIGQSIDDLQLLDDRARPTVIDDERQRVFVLRANVDEVDVESVDLGDELRERVQLRLARAQVVVRAPVASERLRGCERHALGLIRDGLLLGPARRPQAPPKVVKIPAGRRRGRAGCPPSRWSDSGRWQRATFRTPLDYRSCRDLGPRQRLYPRRCISSAHSGPRIAARVRCDRHRGRRPHNPSS